MDIAAAAKTTASTAVIRATSRFRKEHSLGPCHYRSAHRWLSVPSSPPPTGTAPRSGRVHGQPPPVRSATPAGRDVGAPRATWTWTARTWTPGRRGSRRADRRPPRHHPRPGLPARHAPALRPGPSRRRPNPRPRPNPPRQRQRASTVGSQTAGRLGRGAVVRCLVPQQRVDHVVLPGAVAEHDAAQYSFPLETEAFERFL